MLINQPIIVSKTTRVEFRNYTDDEINQYVSTGAPFDKSGGYAIQDRRFKPATKIDGCYLNVVGLPICTLKEQIDKISPDYAKSIKAKRIQLSTATDNFIGQSLYESLGYIKDTDFYTYDLELK